MDILTSIFDNELGCTAFTVERITYPRHALSGRVRLPEEDSAGRRDLSDPVSADARDRHEEEGSLWRKRIVVETEKL